MANPFGGSSSSGDGNPFATPSSRRRRRRNPLGFVGGFIGNLAGDVKDAVVGLPAGITMLATDPVESFKTMGAATWQTWSPLFSGDLGKFGRQFYDHPLAPMLDVATVFTAGAGGAARGAGALSKAGVKSPGVRRVAGLREPKNFPPLRDDPSLPGHARRADIELPMSRRAGRRILQEGRLKIVDPHLPKWYAQHRFDREFTKQAAHAKAATNQILSDQLQYVGILKAGQALSDPQVAKAAYKEIVSVSWQGLDRHAPTTARSRFTAGKTTKLSAPPEGYGFLLDHDSVMKKIDKLDSPEAFEEWLKHFGAQATTRNPAKAFRRADGSIPMIRVKDAADLGIEGANSSRMARWLWHNPTNLWKMLLLGWTPRTVTNNGVGNWLLYSMRQSGNGATVGIYDAIRLTHGERRARQLAQPGMYGARNELWTKKWHQDEIANTFAGAVDADLGSRLARMAPAYKLTRVTSDKPVRIAALAAFYRKNPEVQRLMKSGHTFDEAVDAALAQNPVLREEASRHARSIAGDYIAMRPWERTMRDLVPFYLWDRHIVKTTGTMLLEQPGRLAAMQRISNLGLERVEEILGEVPDFLKGVVPFSLLGLSEGSGDRKNVFLTYSLNPYGTIGELMAAAEAVTTGGGPRPGSAIAGQLNPILSGAAEFFTGQDILTGAPHETTGGLPVDIALSAGETLPFLTTARSILEDPTDTSPSGEPLLYTRDATRGISSFLGVPIRRVSKKRANELAERER